MNDADSNRGPAAAPDRASVDFLSHSSLHTERLGERLAAHAVPGEVIALFGELGAGKTVLARGIGIGLGIDEDTVTSPTFVILHEHFGGRLPLFHLDLYRLRQQDLGSTGWEECLEAGGITMEIAADIRSAVWSKLLLNLASGPIAVLTGAAGQVNLTEPAIERAVRAIYAEGEAVARALGCTPVVDVGRSLANSRGNGHKPSILQDLELGRPMEVATIFDATLQLARLVGVPTPTLDFVVALARTRARTAGLLA